MTNTKPITDAELARLDLRLLEQPGHTINYASITPAEYAALRERLRLAEALAADVKTFLDDERFNRYYESWRRVAGKEGT